MRLAVELYGTTIGTLQGDARNFDFTPNEQAIAEFGVNSPVLSVSIPLTATQRRDHAGRRRNWFAELLPEGDQYAYMLAQSGVRRGDTLAFLARYGRDVAGRYKYGTSTIPPNRAHQRLSLSPTPIFKDCWRIRSALRWRMLRPLESHHCPACSQRSS